MTNRLCDLRKRLGERRNIFFGFSFDDWQSAVELDNTKVMLWSTRDVSVGSPDTPSWHRLSQLTRTKPGAKVVTAHSPSFRGRAPTGSPEGLSPGSHAYCNKHGAKVERC